MPFEKIDANEKLQEKLQNDYNFAKGFQETEKEFDIISDIIERRNKLGFNQGELAKKIGVKQQFVSKLETQKQSPTLRSFLKVLDGLDLEIQLVEKVKPSYNDLKAK